jgi:hypothetical protein
MTKQNLTNMTSDRLVEYLVYERDVAHRLMVEAIIRYDDVVEALRKAVGGNHEAT